MKKTIAILTIAMTMAVTGVTATSVMGASSSSFAYSRGAAGGWCYC